MSRNRRSVFSPISPNSGIAQNTSFLAALVCIGVFSICSLFIYICICYGSVNHTAFCMTKVIIQLHPSVIYTEDKLFLETLPFPKLNITDSC